jgi:hypothetical protein
MSECFGFMVYQLAISVLYIFNHVFVQKYERTKVIVTGCPSASLRSVNIRRHRSPTRGIIARFSSKSLLDFRRTRSLRSPRFSRARKLNPVFRVFVSDYFSILSACIIDDRQPNQPLRPRPWQRQVWRQKKGKASDRDQNRQHDESDRLSPQKWAVRLCAVGEPGAAKPVT